MRREGRSDLRKFAATSAIAVGIGVVGSFTAQWVRARAARRREISSLAAESAATRAGKHSALA